ncbi:MAG TPA: ATP-binding protein [Gammaproteobacteria bacterium]|nr:ATP-binding protein [Gammaproteobacteria bacterium]
MAKLPWKCWHDVVTLRDDLKSGELPLHMFAADLYEVIMQSGKRPIYEDPEKFFALTFPTFNLRQLVRDVVLRVAGKNDKAVRQLELTYGGGKTHTLITLYHLVSNPSNLPDLPAVAEFVEAIGQRPPKARVAGLCFDKLDVEKGMEVRSPDGKVRTLKQPWSVLAYQLAGDEGLKLLHADSRAEERESAPAENLLTALLELPVKDGLGVLILIDEVLMYAREKAAMDEKWKDRIVNFFQYLTQAATKVDRCCVVASLLASDPAKSDTFGRQLQGELYDIFQRQREEAVEPVVKEDVAEVLRRRFFTPDSIKDRDAFRPHVQAALKGIFAIDEQTAKQGSDAEERFLKSYPFHPDLTEVFYTKWTQLDRFQKARGVLRTFALALREAEKWDTSPLVGLSVFLTAPGKEGLSEALRELVTVADTEESEGRRQAWTGILEGELERARETQRDLVGLRFREVEQAVVCTFLHSQPIGQSGRTRDLFVLLGATRPDRIELEKGLNRWAQVSFWLDDRYTAVDENQLPGTWRLGNRPNLTQMHAVAAGRVSDDIVRARLLDEISKVKSLSAGASAAGVRVHTLPTRPRDIEDDGQFHYAILGPSAASDSGKPSPEAKRFLDETTGPEKPRVYRNAVLLLTPSKDGLEIASARVRDYLAWEQVRSDLKEQEKDGDIDVARMQTLAINIDKAKGRIPEAIKQAYCIVVTVSEKNEVQAFKINVTEAPHFSIIKSDSRSRVQDSPITAEALLPDGPYNLWREGETSRRVKDLSGAFAQLPHLPKMLKAQAILDTLADGCEQGSFVLRLTRPDGSFRTWWHTRPDEMAMDDPALELILPEAAELAELPYHLLAPGRLPELWKGDEVSVQDVLDYFSGETVVQVQRDGYMEPVSIPKASADVINAAIAAAVESGTLWLVSGPASVLAEPIPAGVLTPKAILRQPPDMIAAAEILPENLPDAWSENQATALSIATALSQKFGQTLPWKTVKDVISAALNARFLELDATSGDWPCDYPAAQSIILKVATGRSGGPGAPGFGGAVPSSKCLIATAELEPAEIQDLGELVPKLLEIKAKAEVPIKFKVQIELGDGKDTPPQNIVDEINALLEELKDGLHLE